MRSQSGFVHFVLLLFLFLPGQAAVADVLQLKNGRVLRGKFAGISERGTIIFKTGNRRREFPITAIKDLKVAPDPPPKKPAPRAERPVPATPPAPVEPATKRPPVIPPPTRQNGRGLAWQVLIPGLPQWQAGRRPRGWLLAGLFAGFLLRMVYYTEILNREWADANRDPLYQAYINGRGDRFGHLLDEIRYSAYGAALVYAGHLADYSLAEPAAAPEKKLRVGIMLRF